MGGSWSFWSDWWGPPVEDSSALLHELIEAAADAHPESIAVRDPARGLAVSFGELEARANRLAWALRDRGVGVKDRVAWCSTPSFETPAVMLGILKAGAAFVPMDPKHPADRLAQVLEDAEAKVVLAEHPDALPGSETPESVIAAATRQDRPDPIATREDPAYLIYTSGSTGRPKGVVVPHRGVVQYVEWARAKYEVAAGGGLPFHGSIAFDSTATSPFPPLACGTPLTIVDTSNPSTPDPMAEHLRHHGGYNYIKLTPLHAELLAQMLPAERLRAATRSIVVGGEQLYGRQVEPWLRAGVKVFNEYGPTEASVSCVAHELEPDHDDPGPVPIGTRVGTARLYVVNEHGAPAGPEEVGDLLIAGDCLALGYRKRPELTSERFVLMEVDGKTERVMRSRDEVFLDADGLLRFVRRLDGQVKVRGYRVELGDVENALNAHPTVLRSVAAVQESSPKTKELVAYVVQAKGAPEPDLRSLQDHLRDRLPSYMIPARIGRIEEIPTKPNGKVDREALPRAFGADTSESEHRASLNDEAVRSVLARVWQEVLDQPPTDGSHFFDAGGTSALALRFVSRARSEGVSLTVVDLYDRPVFGKLAEPVRTRPLQHGVATDRSATRADPIAVVGMAGRWPGSPDVESLWQNLLEGRDCIRRFEEHEIPWFQDAAIRNDPGYVPARGVVEGWDRFDPAFFGMSPSSAMLVDPQIRLLLLACHQALEDAGLIETEAARVGVVAGVANNTYRSFLTKLRPDFCERVGEMALAAGNEKDFVATTIAHRLDLRGPAISVNTACSTSLVALVQAFWALRNGLCEAAVVGGACVKCPPERGHVHNEGSIHSADGTCRPFDAEATGTVFSDGVAAVVLQPLSAARRAGRSIHGIIRGGAINNDGGMKASFAAPSVEGQAEVIAAALESAGLSPDDIDVVEAHGTATPIGDPIEMEGLGRVFRGRTRPDPVRVGSVKSNLGHLDAAAGLTGLIKLLLCLRHDTLVPTVHHRTPNPRIDFDKLPFRVIGDCEPWVRQTESPRRGGVSSFGIGGTNAHVVVEEAPKPAPLLESGPGLLAVSAHSPAAFERNIRSLSAWWARHPDLSVRAVGAALATRRKAQRLRAAVWAETSEEGRRKLEAVKPNECSGDLRVGFMFPGQGVQALGMGRQLFERFDGYRTAFRSTARLASERVGLDLERLILEVPEEPEEARHNLTQTRITQPALFAVELALARQWQAWGVQPSVMVGHSIGEFVAAVLAGILSEEDAIHLVAERGRLMQDLPSGVMLSVRTGADRVQALTNDRVQVAADNGPELCVLAGPEDGISDVESALDAVLIPHKRLHTSHAFHSAMMDPVVEPLSQVAAGFALKPPELRIMSTVTAEPMSATDATDPGYWGRHARATVRFRSAIAAASAECDILLEVGPRATLGSLARQTASDRKIPVFASMPSTGKDKGSEVADLLSTAGKLWSAGVPVRISALDERSPALCLPPYPFDETQLEVVAEAHVTPSPTPAPAERPHPAAPTSASSAATSAPVVPAASAPSTGAAHGLADFVKAQLRVLESQLQVLQQRRPTPPPDRD
jgi:amino acid adenylation domain-containing protein